VRKGNFDQALAYAFLLLKYRVRSKRETITRLGQKGYAPETIQQVVDYLQENKYLDDNTFACAFTEYAVAKGWGPRKINFELKRFGIADVLRKEALSKVNYHGRLKNLIEQKLQYYRSRDKNVSFACIRQKVLRLLMARGFSYREIAALLEDREAEYSENI